MEGGNRVYWGQETEKALNNFGINSTDSVLRANIGTSMPRELIRAYAEVKMAALCAQQEYSNLYPPDYFPILKTAVREIIEGKHDIQFPLDLRQGGAGTSIHMNINEVIANLANSRYSGTWSGAHPLDHIALYQSTNDTFPTAITIMVYRYILLIEKELIHLQEILVEGELKYQSVLMVGRTELQDALPITLGQVFASWAGPIERDRWRFHKLKERLRNIALGGTAIGTCYSAPKKYVFIAEKNLRAITGLPLCRSQNLTDAVSNKDCLSETAQGFKIAAGNIRKLCNDLLLYTSSFLGELKHPDLQYGSTIMPLKTNPILLEYVKGLAMDGEHEADKIHSYANEGQLQLNSFLPFMARSFQSLFSSLSQSYKTLSFKFFPGMVVNEDRIRSNLLESNALINTLRSRLGYSLLKELMDQVQEQKPSDMKELGDILKKLLISQGINLNTPIESLLDPSLLTTYSNSADIEIIDKPDNKKTSH